MTNRGVCPIPGCSKLRETRRNSEIEARQIKRQVRVVKRIVQQLDSPLSLHVCGLTHELRLLLSGPLMTAGSRLVMNQIRVRRPNVSETGSPQPQAKIHVVETDREIRFIEPTGFLENFLAHEHARARHGRAVLLQKRAIEITRVSVRHSRKGMSRDSPQPEDHAPMLQRAI